MGSEERVSSLQPVTRDSCRLTWSHSSLLCGFGMRVLLRSYPTCIYCSQAVSDAWGLAIVFVATNARSSAPWSALSAPTANTSRKNRLL